ncbi:MAG TPA: hypothetical protein VF831_06510 [Anaerolineales bacterium]
MKRIGLVLSTILLVVLGVSCSGLVYTPNPTALPADYIPTVIALTHQAGESPTPAPTQTSVLVAPQPTSPTPTLVPSSTPGPTATALEYNPTTTSSPIPSTTSTLTLSVTPNRRATRTPTITPTPTLPVAGVQINEPGPMSRLVSPLHVIANLRSLPSGTYHIEIWAEPLHQGDDAQPLYKEVQRLISNPIDWVFIDQDIEFELSRVSEFGQLRLGMYDTYGRPVSVNSVDLLLLSMGASEITPSEARTERIVIREPTPNQLIQGGKVIVSGLAKPGEDFMLVELVAADGSIVGYRQVFVTPAADGSYVPYAIEVPYEVSNPTWVRLTVSESSTRIPGIEHLTSVVVLVSP